MYTSITCASHDSIWTKKKKNSKTTKLPSPFHLPLALLSTHPAVCGWHGRQGAKLKLTLSYHERSAAMMAASNRTGTRPPNDMRPPIATRGYEAVGGRWRVVGGRWATGAGRRASGGERRRTPTAVASVMVTPPAKNKVPHARQRWSVRPAQPPPLAATRLVDVCKTTPRDGRESREQEHWRVVSGGIAPGVWPAMVTVVPSESRAVMRMAAASRAPPFRPPANGTTIQHRSWLTSRRSPWAEIVGH